MYGEKSFLKNLVFQDCFELHKWLRLLDQLRVYKTKTAITSDE